MPPRPGIYGTTNVILTAIDGSSTPRSMVLVGVQGDPSWGDELPDQSEQIDVYERNEHIGKLPGQQQALAVSWSALDCAETQAFADFVLFRGTTATVSTDQIGGLAVKLRVLITPPSGSPRVIEYARAYCRISPAGGTPATIGFSADCYDRTVS